MAKEDKNVLAPPTETKEKKTRNRTPLVPFSLATPSNGEIKGAKRLTRPRLIKPEQIPVGSQLTFKVEQVIDSISKRCKGKLMLAKHNSGEEFLFPITGVIAGAIGEEGKVAIGKTITLLRREDGESANYRGNRMFVFDVFLS